MNSQFRTMIIKPCRGTLRTGVAPHLGQSERHLVAHTVSPRNYKVFPYQWPLLTIP